jgi:uncharacterized protein (TIGR03437 family)
VPVAPALFNSTGQAIAEDPTGALISNSNPAKAAGWVVLYGTGFGQTTPPLAVGISVSQSAPISSAISKTTGAINSEIEYAGLIQSGLYQINVKVPELASGTYPVVATAGGVVTSSVMLPVQGN